MQDRLRTLIAANDASFAYPGAPSPALSNVSLKLPESELVILLGPNGGGKTTLFRGLTGELAPSAGALEVRAPLSYLPQHDRSRTDFPVSALDVTLMGTLAERRPWRRPGRSARSRAREALARVGLADHAGTGYGKLSGGQRRRVLLARTIVQESPIVLLDEPLAGVDPASAEVIDTALRGLRDDGRLVIVASHDIEQARRADRVICLNGRVVADGPPDKALDRSTLQETYAAELTLLPAGGDAVGVIEHHHHH